MGKWNQRWLPRKKYRQETTYSPSHFYQSRDLESNVPLWEREFCLKVGSVPWQKVMITKKFMDCHDSVLKWNDSASEDTFNNAKKRFRADIDGLPSSIPMPDPNMYVGEIDWNPVVDPKLIVDLDQEFFNPDKGRKIQKLETVDPTPHNYNPWEGGGFKATEAFKDVTQGYRWDASIEKSKRINKAAENPWEQSQTRINRAVDDSAWVSCGDKSWGYQGQLQAEKSKNLDSPMGGPRRKRPGSHHYSLRHKSSRFQGIDCTGGHHWRNGMFHNQSGFA